ncbi:MAG: hypothetical protein MZV64_13325 [Ignavibacteriales bacterium]|nr:hypothetical protein [Ignavibacteriales bacterium]
MPGGRPFPYDPLPSERNPALKHFYVLTMGLVLVVGIWVVVEFRQRARLYPSTGWAACGSSWSSITLWPWSLSSAPTDRAISIRASWRDSPSGTGIVDWPVLAGARPGRPYLALRVHLPAPGRGPRRRGSCPSP